MVDTLMAVEKDGVGYGEMVLFCPLCKRRVDNDMIEDDDYVGGNIMFWCHADATDIDPQTGKYREGVVQHREIFICPEGYNGEHSMYSDGSYEHSCTTRLEGEELLQYCESRGYILADLHNYDCFKVGVLRITQLYSAGEAFEQERDEKAQAKGEQQHEEDESDSDSDSDIDPAERKNIPYHDVDLLCLADSPVCVDHDGICLWYQGECTVCERQYQSYIWGD